LLGLSVLEGPKINNIILVLAIACHSVFAGTICFNHITVMVESSPEF